MSAKPKANTASESTTKLPTMTTTGELIRTTTSNTNTDPLLKSAEDYERYKQDVRVIAELQVDDLMEYQKIHGFVPNRGDTSIGKKGLSSDDQEAVLRGEKRLELVDKEKLTFRAEAIK